MNRSTKNSDAATVRASALPGDHELGVERERRRRHVTGGVGVRERAAEGAEVAHLRVGDGARGLGQQQRVLPDERLARDVVVRGHGADDDHVAVVADPAQLRDAPEIHHQVGRGHPQPEHGEQALATGQHLHLPVSGRPEQGEGLLDGARCLVVELRGDHRAPPFSS